MTHTHEGATTMTDDSKPYARCNTCGVDLPTQADQREHLDTTLAAASALVGPRESASSHRTTVVNPTPEERDAARIRGIVSAAVDDATTRFCERMDDDVRAGRITEDEATAELRHFPDFSDAWDDWKNGA